MAAEKSEARAAARAALKKKQQSELDKAVYNECNKSSGADPGKVKGMLDRGADPNRYKVRRKQAAHSTACLLCSFSFFLGYCGVVFCSFPFAFPLFARLSTSSFFRCCVT